MKTLFDITESFTLATFLSENLASPSLVGV